jgi:outer membrane protein assembly factor BamB
MSAPAIAKTTESTPARLPRLFPGWFTRVVLAGAIIMTIVMRYLPRVDGVPFPLGDQAFGNIFSFLFGAFGVLVAWAWISVRSNYALWIRLLVLFGTPIGIVLFLTVFRIDGFDGNMVVRLTPRWQPVADRRLGQIVTEEKPAGIDLATTRPADFAEFLGPGRKCWIEDPGLATDWTAQPPKLLWKHEIGAGWGAFSAVNGYAVTMEQRGEEEWVTCYEIATGKPVWGNSVKARHENPMGGVGPRATPTIAGGRVYALGATGILQCLDGSTGKVNWKQELLKLYKLTQKESEEEVMWGRSASPLIVDDLVVVPAGGKAGRGGGPKSLVAFRAEDGTKAWEAGTDQISYASPSLETLAGRRQIVIVNEKTVTGHDPATGEQLWSQEWDGDSSSSASSSQAVVLPGDLMLLCKGYGGGAKLLDFSTSAAAPSEQWVNTRVLQTKFTNVTVIDGHVYALSDGILECVELETGKRRWKKGRYNHGQILGVGKLILVQAEDGDVALVEANPEQFVELTTFPAIEGMTWNNPCLYGKLLLVRNGEEAACYELP